MAGIIILIQVINFDLPLLSLISIKDLFQLSEGNCMSDVRERGGREGGGRERERTVAEVLLEHVQCGLEIQKLH